MNNCQVSPDSSCSVNIVINDVALERMTPVDIIATDEMRKGTDELNTIEAAKALGVHLDSVRRYVRNGTLRGVVKRGRDYFIPRSEVERLQAGIPVEPKVAAKPKKPKKR